MPLSEVLGLTAFNGLVAQLTGLGVIVVSFLLLNRFAPLEGVVAVWTVAWTAALVAIAAMLLRFLLLSSFDIDALASSTPTSNVLDFVYQAGKLWYAWLLLVGSLMLRGWRPAPVVTRGGAVGLAGYAVLATVFTTDPNGLVLWQVPLMVPLLGATAAALAPGVGRWRRRMSGTGPAAAVAGGMAVLWLLYAYAFRRTVRLEPFGLQFEIFSRFNSYFDLFTHLALGFALAHVAIRGVHDRLVELHENLARVHERLRHAARFDQLTGVYNRRAFEELAAREGWHEAGDLAVAMLDMDNLKEINDARGHAAGDAALAHLARRLAAALGDAGVVFRWGGDEFLVVCAGCSDPGLHDIIDAALARHDMLPGLGGMGLDVSAGVVHRHPGQPLHDLIARADRAMYEQKFRKRAGEAEQVTLWDPLP